MKKVRILLGVIAIIALTGCLMIACSSDSDSGGGDGASGSSAVNGYQGGKKGSGGGGGGSTPSIEGPSTIFFGAANADDFQTPTYYGHYLSEAPYISVNPGPAISVNVTSASKDELDLKVIFNHLVSVDDEDAISTTFTIKSGSATKVVTVYTLTADQIENGILTVDMETMPPAAETPPFNYLKYYTNDDVDTEFATVIFRLSFDGVADMTGGQYIELPYDSVTLNPANPFASTGTSAGIKVTVSGLTLLTDSSDRIPPVYFGTIGTDSFVELLNPTKAATISLYEGQKPNWTGFGFTAIYKNPRHVGTLGTRSVLPDTYGTAGYRGYGKKDFTYADLADSTATITFSAEDGDSNPISEANLFTGGTAGTLTSAKFTLANADGGGDVDYTGTATLWTMVDNTLTVTAGGLAVNIDDLGLSSFGDVFAYFKETLWPTILADGNKTVNLNYTSTEGGAGEAVNIKALLDLTTDVENGDGDDSWADATEAYVNVIKLNNNAITQATAASKRFVITLETN